MRFVDVRRSGAVFADGVQDDTAALQACLDAARDGGTVYFADGTYLISAALIFYSNQCLRFSDKAVLLRSGRSDPVTRYLLASYSEPGWSGYGGTHDVVICGGVFDGNADLCEKTTLVNTVHCRNITIENCRFMHCAHWHCIELNATENTVVRGCVFDGRSYTAVHAELLNEQVQLDLAREGSYGPVYGCGGRRHIDFCKDDTPCRGIVLENNLFLCAGFPGIGHHGEGAHRDIVIRGNIFDGPSGKDGKSRGYIIFQPQVSEIRVCHNTFLAPDGANAPNIGILAKNPDETALLETDNMFIGSFSERVRRGTTS